MGKRLLYSLVGFGFFAFVGWAIRVALHRHSFDPIWHLALAGSGIAVWMGERAGKLETLEKLRRPVTLFPDGVPGPR